MAVPDTHPEAMSSYHGARAGPCTQLAMGRKPKAARISAIAIADGDARSSGAGMLSWLPVVGV
jgi:hypothetical protein